MNYKIMINLKNIKKIELKNIKGIKHKFISFNERFDEEKETDPFILLSNNGGGKSSIERFISLINKKGIMLNNEESNYYNSDPKNNPEIIFHIENENKKIELKKITKDSNALHDDLEFISLNPDYYTKLKRTGKYHNNVSPNEEIEIKIENKNWNAKINLKFEMQKNTIFKKKFDLISKSKRICKFLLKIILETWSYYCSKRKKELNQDEVEKINNFLINNNLNESKKEDKKSTIISKIQDIPIKSSFSLKDLFWFCYFVAINNKKNEIKNFLEKLDEEENINKFKKLINEFNNMVVYCKIKAKLDKKTGFFLINFGNIDYFSNGTLNILNLLFQLENCKLKISKSNKNFIIFIDRFLDSIDEWNVFYTYQSIQSFLKEVNIENNKCLVFLSSHFVNLINQNNIKKKKIIYLETKDKLWDLKECIYSEQELTKINKIIENIMENENKEKTKKDIRNLLHWDLEINEKLFLDLKKEISWESFAETCINYFLIYLKSNDDLSIKFPKIIALGFRLYFEKMYNENVRPEKIKHVSYVISDWIKSDKSEKLFFLKSENIFADIYNGLCHSSGGKTDKIINSISTENSNYIPALMLQNKVTKIFIKLYKDNFDEFINSLNKN